MEKRIITLQANETIEINGAIITATVAKQLKEFQQSENEMARDFREYISDSICRLVIILGDYNELEKEADGDKMLSLLVNLSYCKDYLTNVEAPHVLPNNF
jgi:hypothetical protein